MQNLASQATQDRETNQAQIRLLQEHLAHLRQTQPTPFSSNDQNESMTSANIPIPPVYVPHASTETPLPESPPQARKKPLLPDPPKFVGTKTTFRAWLLEMRNKLRVDGHLMGRQPDQFAYIFSRLERTPQNMTIAFMERGGSDGNHNPNQYLEYLESCYGDPNIQSRAIDRLQKLAQKNAESFSSFLPKFERELADGGGSEWTDQAKVSWLKGALNPTIKKTLVGIYPIPTRYPDYVKLLQTVGSQLEGLDTGRNSTSSWRRSTTPPRNADRPDQMEWEPTRIQRMIQQDNEQLQGKRAKWVSREEMIARRKEGRCMRCGRSGCNVGACPLSPATRPKTHINQSRPVLETETEAQYEDSDEESLKE